MAPWTSVSSSGCRRWRSNSSPSFASDGTIYFGSDDFSLYALNSDGSKKWGFTANGWIKSAAAIGRDGAIYFTSDDARRYALNPDGSKRWDFAIGNASRSSPALGNNSILYFGSISGSLFAVQGSSLLATNSWPMFRRNLQHTASLDPVVITVPPVFLPPLKLTNGQIQLPLTQVIARSYQLETSTNLTSWTTLTNLAATTNFLRWIDTDSTKYNRRFFRALIP